MRMGLFENFIKAKVKEGGARDAARETLEALVTAMARCDVEETIKMTKRPYKGKGTALNLSIQYSATSVAGPVYASYIVGAIAETCGVSFESMISMAKTVHELMPEIGTEKRSRGEDGEH